MTEEGRRLAAAAEAASREAVARAFAAYEVWALATNGARLENLPTSVSEGCLHFRADVLGSDGKARFLYEIVRK